MPTIEGNPSGFERLKAWAHRLKTDILALWIAARDSRTPFGPKLIAAIVAAYALSPIDLVPDFIPILGYVDDLIILPFGIALAVRLIPQPLMKEYRATASAQTTSQRSLLAGLLVIALWVAALAAFVLWLF